ncbi:MAG: hypothetical protein UY81_C0043G0003 [Candidatus Giovannonibacteria bacterium GW2011_GWA2_53_7]|uniref:Uncharacterized protein n=1 Tax=Candidatus Giovannonibacteria bacterium GW2011_GWA2_53_7 TaxID=1618650 RepID=A0A0G1XWK9_9BACT|nr:MAG: hypothetical protein UY81_C0043G0003 [Candidatus Giovannonibacteria bacterium GW2011_GWA2_53_7]
MDYVRVSVPSGTLPDHVVKSLWKKNAWRSVLVFKKLDAFIAFTMSRADYERWREKMSKDVLEQLQVRTSSSLEQLMKELWKEHVNSALR